MTKSTDYKLSGITNINEDCQILRYTSFGSVMEGRSFVGDTSGWYRFGFGGQEKDDEIYGKGKTYSAEFWEYDARVGRRWNLDPKGDPNISFYACFNNNPILYVDPKGDKFRNAHTERKKEAAKDLATSNENLVKAIERNQPYFGITRKEARKAGILDDYKKKGNELKVANRAQKKAQIIYNQELEFENLTNDVLKEWEITNPDKYAEFDNFNPNGRGVIDIEITFQKGRIKMTKDNGEPTGDYTTESIEAVIGSKDFKDDYVKLTLQAQKIDGVFLLQAVTGDFVHGLGHIDKGKEQDEKYANEFSFNHYEKYKKKK